MKGSSHGTTFPSAQLKVLKKENAELKRANETLIRSLSRTGFAIRTGFPARQPQVDNILDRQLEGGPRIVGAAAPPNASADALRRRCATQACSPKITSEIKR